MVSIENRNNIMEQKQPLVSVIIPNYNHARYLEQRLDSVLNQTYQNFEVFILDDHSTDNSLEVIARYKDNSHIKQIVVNETNSGSTFKQWDKGIHLATGDIIWIAESDDYCELNMLEELVKAYTSHPNVVLAYSTSIMVDENGTKGNLSRYNLGTRVFSSRDYITHFLAYGCAVGNASSAIFSREAALKVSPEYMSFRGSGDYMFWTEISSQGNVVVADVKLNYFRWAGGSVTHKNYASGHAAEEDMRVWNRIQEICPLSSFHKHLALTAHASQYEKMEYESVSIQTRSHQLWQVKKYCTPFNKHLLWLRGALIRHVRIYL